ncbi:MAG: hypothetical protein JJT76_15975 [Clostridiaceae bacterium]|nr:hypothetical protein [Clostridiaceae bacterium]
MPSISKIRFTNVIYENGEKRYNDDLFEFQGYNGAILLENGGGKTVFIQTALQAILPHADLGERKIKETLSLEGTTSHIAIEWILNDRPRKYALTAVTLFMTPKGIGSYRYAYDYSTGDKHAIENIPFVKKGEGGSIRPSSKGEIQEYYQVMQQQKMSAHTFETIKGYHEYIEKNFQIIASEWNSIARINGAEGDVEKFFEGCKNTTQLVDHLLIPVVEEALEGGGTDDFAQIFQKQREHFKKHKQLRTRIEESKRVEAEINSYVAMLTDLHQLETEMLKRKGEIKGIYSLLQISREENRGAMEENNQLLQRLIASETEYEKKKASYDLALLKRALKEAKEAFEEINNEYVEIKEEHQEKEIYIQNLEVAELKKIIKEKKEAIDLLNEKIAMLEADEEVEILQEKLRENSNNLKGYFVDRLEKIEKDLMNLEGQKKRYTLELEEMKERRKELEKSRRIIEAEDTGLTTEINVFTRQLGDIEKEILDHPLQEKVEEEYEKWQKRAIAIQELNTVYQRQLRERVEEEGKLQERIIAFEETLQQFKKEEIEKDKDLTVLQQKHDTLLLKLKEVQGNWNFVESLYIKEATIVPFLEEKQEKLRLEKEDLICQEGRSNRLLDAYEGHHYFTAEPLIEEWVKNWQGQFKLLEVGNEYLAHAAKVSGGTLDELFEKFPLWASAIVTSEGEVQKLKEKIQHQSEKLTSPVLILSEKEASIIIKEGEEVQERYVFPIAWKNNVDGTRFKKWQEKLKEMAEASNAHRMNKEKELYYWSQLLKEVQDFYETYPNEYYTSTTNDFRNLRDKIYETEKSLKEIKHSSKDLLKQIEDLKNKLHEIELEENHLGGRIGRGQVYFNIIDKRKQLSSHRLKVQQQLEEKKNEIIDIEKSIENHRSIIYEEEGLENKIWKIKEQKQTCLRDPIYLEVQEASVSYSNISLIGLKEEREMLKDQLEKKQEGRANLEDRLQHRTNEKQEKEKELIRKKKQAKYPIDEEVVFPIDGEDLLEQLTQREVLLRDTLQELEPRCKSKEKQYEKQKNKLELREGDFYNKFDTVLEFTMMLEEVKEELQQEKEEIQKHRIHLEKTKGRLEKEEEELQGILRQLEMKNEKYEYLVEGIEVLVLTEEIKQDLPYKRKSIVENLISELEKLFELVEKEKIKKEKLKNKFIQFCNNSIKDVRLREMAVVGIENKAVYGDILDWQKNMNKRILRTIEIIENDMKEHDRQLNQFIHFLHTYLATIAQELKLIPKNTRVKIEDQWKEIFQFTIPVWQELEGKEELRKYIDWMLGKLEDDEYKDDEGNENEGAVKKSIERWLQIKQLLKVVMKDQIIKVKCRKVTNDNKVSNMFFTWDHSNQWSGGEKWSKNMALFLGILNYVAEKKQGPRGNQIKGRTVILDNPFGKASSDHVLTPVFFIAEQLGFQFIALTAHADGKFISDFFPVVYSCKLRKTQNGDSSIFTKEKKLQYAFFKDKDPIVLERIGEQEQIDIFDLEDLIAGV